MALLPGSVQVAQGPPKGLDLAFIGILLAFGQFERFENFFHIVEGLLELVDDMVDLIDGLADRCRRSRARGFSSSGRRSRRRWLRNSSRRSGFIPTDLRF